MLERIQVSGFKSIRQMDLELRPLNILIGANGAGKSNFISLFELLNAILEERLQPYVAKVGGAERLLHFGQKTTSQLYLSLANAGVLYEVTLVPTEADRLTIQSEGTQSYRHSGSEESILANLSFDNDDIAFDGGTEAELDERSDLLNNELRKTATFLNALKIYHFHDTSPSAKMRLTQDLHDNRALQADGGNLAAFLYLLKMRYPQHYRQIVQTIRLVAPFFEDFDLQPTALNADSIRLEWKEKYAEKTFGPHYLSDGTLRFICLATLLLQPDPPSTIIIDEPELGLHPAAINLLASLLKSAATKTQVIVATQSVTLLNQFSWQDVIIVDRREAESQFRRVNEAELATWLDGYGLGDLWEKNTFGGMP